MTTQRSTFVHAGRRLFSVFLILLMPMNMYVVTVLVSLFLFVACLTIPFHSVFTHECIVTMLWSMFLYYALSYIFIPVDIACTHREFVIATEIFQCVLLLSLSK